MGFRDHEHRCGTTQRLQEWRWRRKERSYIGSRYLSSSSYTNVLVTSQILADSLGSIREQSELVQVRVIKVKRSRDLHFYAEVI